MLTIMRKKRFRIPLSEGSTLDVEIDIENKSIVGFVLNLRFRIGEKWHEVYRVDTAHGYLHEQRFWISHEPIPLIQDGSFDQIFEFYMNLIKKDFERFKSYYLKKKSAE